MDKLFLGLALLSLAGNVYLAISWRRATKKALLTETYERLLRVTGKQNSNLRQLLHDKEVLLREIEIKAWSCHSNSELVDELNKLFDGAGGRKAGTVSKPKPPTS